MDYDALLELATEVGFRLLKSGGEIYRVEESIVRLLQAYDVPGAEVFAIPNCIIASAVTPEGKTITRVRRVPAHGTDIDALEAYNGLCRTLCRETPELPEAARALKEAEGGLRQYTLWGRLAGCFATTFFFCLFFRGTWRDALCAGVCGMVICLCQSFMEKRGTNIFFKTLACAAVSALLALALTGIGAGQNVDRITIGALMVLVPGVAITNAMREIMAGDMVSGLSRAAEAVLIATAIAVGTGIAMGLPRLFLGV